MKNFGNKFIALCGLMVLAAAMLAPMAAEAGCPLWVVSCSNGSSYGCAGTPQGNQCFYDMGCINGNRCPPQ